MMLKKTTIIGSIVLIISVLFIFDLSIAAKGSDVVTSVTTGKRRIVSHNIQKAKQGAVSDALKVALQNAFAGLVSSQTFASHLDFFYDQVGSENDDCNDAQVDMSHSFELTVDTADFKIILEYINWDFVHLGNSMKKIGFSQMTPM